MSRSFRNSAPSGLALALLLATSARSADAAVGPPAHLGLTPGNAVVYVGEDQIYTATLYDSTYNEAAVEAGSHIGFAIDMSSFATVTIDASDPHLGHVVGTAVGTTYVRAFYLRDDGTPTDITTMANLTVVPADGTGGTPGTGGAGGAGGAPGTGGARGAGGMPGTGGRVAAGGAGGGLAACANTQCGAACVDLAADQDNCGACDHGCPSSQACVAGLCLTSCPVGKVMCGPGCLDLTADVENCGACGRACAAAATCANGTCLPPQTCAGVVCDGICVDALADPHNCGACGHACLADQTCTAAVCAPAAACLDNNTRCSGTCSDLRFDMANCGRCGASCPESGHECVDGRCVSNGDDGGCAGCSMSRGGSGTTFQTTRALGILTGLAIVLRRRRRR